MQVYFGMAYMEEQQKVFSIEVLLLFFIFFVFIAFC